MYQYLQFKLEKEEWYQINYLLLITKPFFKFMTIYQVFGIYNKLFRYLKASEKQLRRKKVLQKKKMLIALIAAYNKLSEYYIAIDIERFGEIYAMATILALSKKLRFFTTKDQQGHDYVTQYQECLEKEFKQRLNKRKALATVQASTSPIEIYDLIKMLIDL